MKYNFKENHLSVKQRQYLYSQEDEVLFGGARGGGKTYVNRLSAVKDCLTMPGKKILFVRPKIIQSRAQFSPIEMNNIIPRYFIDKSTKKKIEVWKFQKKENMYEFGNGKIGDRFESGSKLYLGGVKTEDDAQLRYQGIEFVSIYWDELTKSEYSAIEFLQASLRDDTYKVKFRASSNPGDISHAIIKKLFIDPWEKIKRSNPSKFDKNFNGKISWKIKKYDDFSKKWIYKTRAYIPAKLDDNPNKNIRDTYLKNLMHLPKHLFEMYRMGSWNTFQGKFWDNVNFEKDNFTTIKELTQKYNINFEWEIENSKTFLSMDWGWNDYTAIYWHLETSKGIILTYKELYVNKLLMKEIAQEVENINKKIKIQPECIYMPWDVYINKGMTESNKYGMEIGDTLIDVWRNYSKIYDVKANNDRIQGWAKMTQALKEDVDYRVGREIFYSKKWLILKNECHYLTEQLETALMDDKKIEDIKTKNSLADHSLDSCRYFFISHEPDPKIKISKNIPPKGTIQYFRFMEKQKREKNIDEAIWIDY